MGTSIPSAPLATPSAAGLMSAAQAAALESGVPISSYTVDVDLAAAPAAIKVIPGVVGRVFTPSRSSQLIVSTAGALTNNPTYSLGTVGPGYTDIVSALASPTSTDYATGAGRCEPSTGNVAYKAVSGADIYIITTTQATGSTQFLVRYTFYGTWENF